MSGVPTRGTVRIDIESCKGCDLCVAACPPGVLAMTTDRYNQRGYRYPELSAGCTGCNRCSQSCPDFVFEVWRLDAPVELPEGPVAESAVHRTVEPHKDEKH
ncbi:4Fe-4S dicluster domain-containing protein [Streptomyces sp. NPDC002896]|uniref:4Fe-4S dicluster domain-containing protein n=1 Tax=Streptomyces sp. NPDC002896 TaxID=3154438 RepID=UPI0033306F09